MYFSEDERLARSLQQSINTVQCLESQCSEKENCKPNDSILELTDPTPSIHDLFVRFDKKFFWSSLGMVQVLWSHRMTKCAGLCYFEGKQGLCKISLSAPLLSLRPRKDLVETLLHEMIHAYLFVTNNYRDRNDHGPEFHKHMYRINKEAGTSISVYHSFHDEVEYYQRHIWRCDGPCQFKKPFYGFVKRSMNRPPGPNDLWWSQHKIECNGSFIKISEPEKKNKLTKSKSSEASEKSKSIDIRDMLKNSSKVNQPSPNKVTSEKTDTKVEPKLESVKPINRQVKKTGTYETEFKIFESISNNEKGQSFLNHNDKSSIKMNKIGNNELSSAQDTKTEIVRDFVRNIWSARFSQPSLTEEESTKKPGPDCKKIKLESHTSKKCDNFEKDNINCIINTNSRTYEHATVKIKTECHICIACGKQIPLGQEMKEHLDSCLHSTIIKENVESKEIGNEINCLSVPCPCCYQWFSESEMDSHIDECLTMIALRNGILD